MRSLSQIKQAIAEIEKIEESRTLAAQVIFPELKELTDKLDSIIESAQETIAKLERQR